MRVDGRDISVSGNLLQPLTRRTNDILRLAASAAFFAIVIAGSLITRPQWVALERSISEIVGVLTPTQSDLVYLAYGIAILALPFAILIGLIAGRQWKLLGAYAAAGVLAVLPLSIGGNGISAPRWHFELTDRPQTVLAQILDDPRWIAMLAAVLTVSGPWLPARWRHWWWALLLAFVPIHLFVSAIVPARSLLGLAVGWFVGALVVLVVGTPALEVPLEGAVRALAKRGCVVSGLQVVRPAGPGPLVLSAACSDSDSDSDSAFIELYGPHQRSGGALLQLWRKLRLRARETAPLVASMRRAVEHRALMTIAVGDVGLANTSTIAVASLDRGWMLYAHEPVRGKPLDECAKATPVEHAWQSLRILNEHQISHGDLRANGITVDDGTVLFGGFGSAEYGATETQLQSDIAQLLVTTSALYDAKSAVGAAIDAFGKDTVLTASRRLTKSAVPKQIRKSIADAGAVISGARAEVKRQTGADQIKTETITRFTRRQVIQLVLLVALVYVAYPFISTVPTFVSQVSKANWWWALLGLVVSALTYVGAAAALWASADESVVFWKLSIAQVANTFAATTTPAGVGGLALSTRYLQKGGGLSPVRATTAVALQQVVQVIMHLVLLILFSTVAGASMDLSHYVPNCHGAVPDRGCGAGHRRRIPACAQAAALAGDGRASEAEGGNGRPRPGCPGTETIGADRTRLRRNDPRCGAGALVQRRSLWRRRDVCHVHRGDDGRRNAGFGRPDTRRRRRRRSGPDRWSGRLRRTRGHRRAVGPAVSRAHLLATRIRRVAGDAMANGERDDLTGSRFVGPGLDDDENV